MAYDCWLSFRWESSEFSSLIRVVVFLAYYILCVSSSFICQYFTRQSTFLFSLLLKRIEYLYAIQLHELFPVVFVVVVVEIAQYGTIHSKSIISVYWMEYIVQLMWIHLLLLLFLVYSSIQSEPMYSNRLNRFNSQSFKLTILQISRHFLFWFNFDD